MYTKYKQLFLLNIDFREVLMNWILCIKGIKKEEVQLISEMLSELMQICTNNDLLIEPFYICAENLK